MNILIPFSLNSTIAHYNTKITFQIIIKKNDCETNVSIQSSLSFFKDKHWFEQSYSTSGVIISTIILLFINKIDWMNKNIKTNIISALNSHVNGNGVKSYNALSDDTTGSSSSVTLN